MCDQAHPATLSPAKPLRYCLGETLLQTAVFVVFRSGLMLFRGLARFGPLITFDYLQARLFRKLSQTFAKIKAG
jgi:hypothetical protein